MAGLTLDAGALIAFERNHRPLVVLIARCTSNRSTISAREAGQLCGVCGTTDVIDASVVLCARARGHAIVTSDSADIRRLDGSIPVIAC